MKVTLLSYTPDALTLLLKTKNTRLKFESDPAKWSEEKRAEHLAYMRDTIRSSWEFVNYVFQIEDVSRAFTHQLVRTRTGSYAQESQRTVDARDNNIFKPQAIMDDAGQDVLWDAAVQVALGTYGTLLDRGAAAQDARGLLPTNITTSIIAQFNLRSLHDMGELRLCTRTQGEYQDVFRAMRAAVIAVHPWAEEFIEVFCVNHGHCAFPRYGAKECPIYQYVMPQEELERKRIEIRAAWTATRHEARPVAVGGKAQ